MVKLRAKSRRWRLAVRTLSWSGIGSLLVLLVLAGAMGLGLLWLAANTTRHAPLDLMPYAPRIQAFLKDRGLFVQADALQLYYDDSPVLRVDGLRILGTDGGPDGGLAVYVESAAVKLSNGRLMRLVISPKVIEAKNVTLRLVRGTDNVVRIAGLALAQGNTAPDETRGVVEWLDDLPGDNLWGRIKHVRMQGVTLLLRDDVQRAEWVLEDGKLSADRFEDSGERASLLAQVRRLTGPNLTVPKGVRGLPIPVLVTLERAPEAEVVTVEAKLGQLNAAVINDYLPPVLQELMQAQGTLALGSLLTRGNRLGTPWLTLRLKQARLNLPDKAGFSKPIVLPQLEATLSYTPSPTDMLDVKSMAITGPRGNLLVVSGSVMRVTTDPTLALTAFSPGGDVQAIADFIPDANLKTRKTYAWMRNRLKDATYRNMTATIGLRLNAFPGCGDACGRLDIDAEVMGGKVIIMPELPPAEIVPVVGSPARFFWRRQTVGVIAPKAKIDDHQAGSVWVSLDNLLTPSPTLLTISGTLAGKVESLVAKLNGITEVNGRIPTGFTGKHSSVLLAHVPLVKNVSATFASSTIQVTSTVTDLAVRNLPVLQNDVLTASRANVVLLADKTFRVVAPEAQLAGESLALTWQQNLQPKMPTQMALNLKGTVGGEWLQNLIGPGYISASGGLGVQLEAKEEQPDVWAFRGSANANRTALTLGPVTYRKPIGEALTVQATGRFAVGEELALASVMVKGAQADISGSLKLPLQAWETGTIRLNPFKLGKTDASLTLANKTLTLRGQSFDASGLRLFDDGAPNTDAKDLALDVQVGTLMFGSGVIEKAIVQAQSTAARWQLQRLTGVVDGGGVNIRKNGARMDINIDNLGRTLEVFGLYDKLKEGRVNGSLAIVGPESYRGEVRIESFELRNPPTMMKILGLLSLEQLVAGTDTTKFSKGRIPLAITRDAFTLNDARFTGPSMDLRLNGNYWRADEVMDFKGGLAPAIPFNRLVTKIPLLGGLLSGSQDGVVVADFRLKGPTDNPEVTVQPLSVLTPGLIKDIFR